jgi:enoyl-CoA hydratase/carnithine racemase
MVGGNSLERMMSEVQHWLLTEEAHIAILTLNRPEAMNSLTAETLYELRDITAYLRTRKNAWVVIVQGQGKHFSIGMDVNVIKGRLDQSEQPTVNTCWIFNSVSMTLKRWKSQPLPSCTVFASAAV